MEKGSEYAHLLTPVIGVSDMCMSCNIPHISLHDYQLVRDKHVMHIKMPWLCFFTEFSSQWPVLPKVNRP